VPQPGVQKQFVVGCENLLTLPAAPVETGERQKHRLTGGSATEQLQMNKAELIESIQEKLGSSKDDAAQALQAITDSIFEGVKKDEVVQIIGFGTFKISKRAARDGRNPQTGEKIKIKASKSIKFTPSAGVKKEL